jgi:DNA-binding CsgD family transcriptional regulator
MKDVIVHYGTPRHSGRYPWGSGEDPEQRNKSFLGYVDSLRKQGQSEVDIAKGLGMKTSELRAKKAIAKSEQRKADYAEVIRLKNKGMSNVEIGKRMGINESSVRSLLNPVLQERSDVIKTTADMLKDEVAKKGYIDVGAGVENHIGVSRTKLKTSLSMLEEEGYTIHYIPVEQLGTGKKTTLMTLAAPGTKYQDVYNNKDKIKMVGTYSEDGGRSFLGLEPIRNVDSKRVMVRYAEDGGINKDGVIELRRGVSDISLGNAKYAQVRIGVNGTHYLKGMAMYSDNIPNGVDMVFNTNKHIGTPMLGSKDNTVLKTMKDDPDNPFGATVRQKHYISDKGLKTKHSDEMLELIESGHAYSDIAKRFDISEDLVRECIPIKALNIVNEEGDWGKWSKTLSSQMLSKQSPSLAKKQLGLAYDAKKEEYDEIMELTLPAIRKKLLDSFADDCDSSAVHLRAASLPRQATHVILPINSLSETEVYAPNYRDGENVVLIRYPHGGKFEIPELVVNNKNKEANSVMHNAKDAIGINAKVAERLSGADFDGDNVLVIPNNNGAIDSKAALKGLKNFDPKESYPAYEGMQRISPRTKQLKMGDVSNLITDMTIKGANTDEIARAVRHSMVVIDSEKHNLNYKQSYIDNGIADLKRRYQGSERSGASTLISKASSEVRVGVRKEKPADALTGKKVYEYTGETYTNRSGKIIRKTTTSTKMAETDDAFSLSSGTMMETVYANHANKLKALANTARKDSIATKFTPYSPSAKVTYASEVSDLKHKLNIALKNKPLERQAQLLANKVVTAKREANPDMDAADIKKIKGQALTEARSRIGAKKQRIDITDKEWEAIQAGAISTNTLTQILNNTDLDRVKQLATPRTALSMTPAKMSRARQMLSTGYTQAEVADAIGVSTSVLSAAIG